METVTVIPAQPGYFVIYSDGEDERTNVPPVGLDPIIAWQIETFAKNGEHFSSVEPIGLEGTIPHCEYGIMRPDGTVDRPGHRSFATVAEYIAAVRSEAKK